MVAEGAQEALPLGPEIVVVRGHAEGGPVRQLGLEVDAQTVGGLERGLRRAPGVEAVMIESPRLADLEDALPAGDVHRRVAREGEDAAVVSPAQEGRTAIDRELRPLGLELTQAEAHTRLVTVGASVRA